jgi:hypothetical protein
VADNDDKRAVSFPQRVNSGLDQHRADSLALSLRLHGHRRKPHALCDFVITGDNDRAEEDVAKNLVIFYRDKRHRIRTCLTERVDDVSLRRFTKGRPIYRAHHSDVVWLFWSYDYHVSLVAND